MSPVAWNQQTSSIDDDDYYHNLLPVESYSTDYRHRHSDDDIVLPENYAGYLKDYTKPHQVEEPPAPVPITGNSRSIGAPSPLRERAGLERKRKRDQARQYKSKMRAKVRQMLKKQSNRRLGLWRSRVLDGDRVAIYVSLDGIAYPRGRDAYTAQERDQKALTRMSINEYGPNSSILNPRSLPYCQHYPPLTPTDLRFWHLPPNIVEAYRLSSGITGLYTWQSDCLRALLGCSIFGFQEPTDDDCTPAAAAAAHRPFKCGVYCAPTSGGKSLVAELIMLRRLLFRGLRGLYTLPYVSICQEKLHQLRRVWGDSAQSSSLAALRIEAFHSNASVDKEDLIGGWTAGVDVALGTLEKINGMVNRLVSQADSSTANVGTVIIDELHMIGDEQRGHILELILLKLMLFATGRVSAASAEPYELQVVCMSATLPSLDPLKSWLIDADTFNTEFRPVPLEYFIKVGPRLHSPELDKIVRELPVIRGDPDRITALVWEVAQEACSELSDQSKTVPSSSSSATGVIVFCATKVWCEKTATHLANTWPGVPWDSDETIIRGRRQAVEILRACPAGLSPILERCIPSGIAYHHSGHTMEERRVIETAFRNGYIHTLCATSTLAAGVNLPARRVIIRSLQVGIHPLDASRLRQMCGRAGRAGFGDANRGEAVLCVKDDREAKVAKDLINAQLTGLSSRLTGPHLARALLEIICLKLINNVDEIPQRFCHRLLRYHLQPDEEARQALRSELSTCLTLLKKDGFVKVNDEDGQLRSTPLGEAVAFSSLEAEEASIVFRDLKNASCQILLSSDLHLLYLVTPVRHGIPVRIEPFLRLYNSMTVDQRKIATRCGIDEGFLNAPFLRSTTLSLSTPVPACKQKSPEDVMKWRRQLATHVRFYATLVLHHLLKGMPLPNLAANYQVNCGQIQQLQSASAAYCGMVVGFCERLRWWALAAALTPLSEQLSTGAPAYIAEMTSKLSHVGLSVSWAAALHSAGMETVKAIAASDTDTVHRILYRATGHQRTQGSDDFDEYLRESAKSIIVGAQEVVNAQVAQILEEAENCRASADEASSSEGDGASSASSASSANDREKQEDVTAELDGDLHSLLDGLSPDDINAIAT